MAFWRRFDFDYSKNIKSELFRPDDVARYGLHGKTQCLAQNPLQSLLAVGTTDRIYIFGQSGVQLTFNTSSQLKHLRFWREYLIAFDAKSLITQYSLAHQQAVAHYSFPGSINAVEVDESLDWAFLGMQNGETFVWDLSRRLAAPFKIPALVKSRYMSPVLSLQLHPRDIGIILVGYAESAVAFSFKTNTVIGTLMLEIPIGAPGPIAVSETLNAVRRPSLTSAHWHPAGYHVLTAHEGGCLAFWAHQEGKLLQLRTLEESNLHLSLRPRSHRPGNAAVRENFQQVAWSSSENTDNTSILVSGGLPGNIDGGSNILTLLDFGKTPSPTLTSYEAMASFYANPRRQRIFPCAPNVGVQKFCLVTKTPYVSGGSPQAVICVLSSGEIEVYEYADGRPISAAACLPPSLSWIWPQVYKFSVDKISRARWLGFKEQKVSEQPLFIGGALAKRHLRSFEWRNALLTAHDRGLLRIWDASHGEVESSEAMEIDLALALEVESYRCPRVTEMQLQGETGEIVVGFASGDLLVCRFGRPKPAASGASNTVVGITDVRHRVPQGLSEGFIPQYLLATTQYGKVTCLQCSEIGL